MRRVVFKARFLSLVIFAMLAGVWPMAAQAAGGPPSLGAAASFAVLAGTGAVTCSASATIIGNVGVYPGTTITPGNCSITGNLHRGDGVAQNAHNAFISAYDQFKALSCPSGNTLTTLDGQVLLPGIWCVDAAATSTGSILTLNGLSTDTWIFKIGTVGTGALTGTNFSVVMANGTPPPCNNVYWWAAEAVTMTDSNFVGTILAGAAISIKRGTFSGRALAKVAVTIVGPGSNTVVGCGAAGIPGSECNQGSGNDEDKDSDQSKDKDAAADRNESVKRVSERSNEGKDKDGNGHEGCESGDSDKDNSDKDNSDKDNSDKHDSDKDDSKKGKGKGK